MYAIVENCGKQYKVAPGMTVKMEKLSLEKGSDFTLDRVLMIAKEGTDIFGSPYVEGAKVIALVDDTGKARKVMVHKQRPRKVYRKTRGHRQPFTTLKIKEIVFGG